MGITIYHFKKADKSKRPVKGIGTDYVVTGPGGLYNENLTPEELMLVRTIMWDAKEHFKNMKYIRDIDVTNFIQSWLLTSEKIPTIYPDIKDAIENGVNYEPRA